MSGRYRLETFPENGSGTVISQFRGIVVLAQMTQEDIPEPWMDETADGIRTFVVAQMTVTLDYPPLKVIGIRTGHQHVHIVIGFDYHVISLSAIFISILGHPAQVGHEHETCAEEVLFHLPGDYPEQSGSLTGFFGGAESCASGGAAKSERKM